MSAAPAPSAKLTLSTHTVNEIIVITAYMLSCQHDPEWQARNLTPVPGESLENLTQLLNSKETSLIKNIKPFFNQGFIEWGNHSREAFANVGHFMADARKIVIDALNKNSRVTYEGKGIAAAYTEEKLIAHFCAKREIFPEVMATLRRENPKFTSSPPSTGVAGGAGASAGLASRRPGFASPSGLNMPLITATTSATPAPTFVRDALAATVAAANVTIATTENPFTDQLLTPAFACRRSTATHTAGGGGAAASAEGKAVDAPAPAPTFFAPPPGGATDPAVSPAGTPLGNTGPAGSTPHPSGVILTTADSSATPAPASTNRFACCWQAIAAALRRNPATQEETTPFISDK